MQTADDLSWKAKPANDPGRKRTSARRALRITAPLLRGQDRSHITVLDLSPDGMLFESDLQLHRGDRVDVELQSVGVCRAKIIWAADLLYGCRFDQRLDDAAMARVHDATPPVTASEGPDAELASAIKRARQRAGLSLEVLARQLGVSKQTVWFWEKGRHSPTPDRLAALRAVLGPSLSLPDPDQSPATASTAAASSAGAAGAAMEPLAQLVADAKDTLARAAGTSADRITITIGY